MDMKIMKLKEGDLTQVVKVGINGCPNHYGVVT